MATTEKLICTVTIWIINYMQALNQIVITYKYSPLCSSYHRFPHEQAHPLLGMFCLPGPSYNQGKGKNMRKNCLSSVRQINAHILGSNDTKQRFLNFCCFGDHDTTKVLAVFDFLHCETSAQKFMEFFLILYTYVSP